MRIFALLLLAISHSAIAWNESGHRQTAYIAYNLVSEKTREKVVTLIKSHPRYRKDFVNHQPENFASWSKSDQEQWLFSQIAVWPDLARKIQNESEKEKYHNGQWHYINLPVWPNKNLKRAYKGQPQTNQEQTTPHLKKQLNIVQSLNYMNNLLRSGKNASSQPVNLCWIFHQIGDIHQPLHSSAIFTQNKFNRGDRGGNDIKVGDKNLHFLWDNAASKTNQHQALKRLAYIATSSPRLKKVGERASYNLNFATWLSESHLLAKKHVYGYNIDGKQTIADSVAEYEKSSRNKLEVTLDNNYEKNMEAIAKKRVVVAGYRLGGLLESMFL